MKILLIDPHFCRFIGYYNRYFPIGIAYLAAKLNTKTIAVGLMVPYPDTIIFSPMARNGYRLLSQNWNEYDKYGGKVLKLKSLPYKVC